MDVTLWWCVAHTYRATTSRIDALCGAVLGVTGKDWQSLYYTVLPELYGNAVTANNTELQNKWYEWHSHHLQLLSPYRERIMTIWNIQL